MKTQQNVPMGKGARVKIGAGMIIVAIAPAIPVAWLSLLATGGGLILAFLGFREDYNAKQR
jgi:hypothetical protein